MKEKYKKFKRNLNKSIYKTILPLLKEEKQL